MHEIECPEFPMTDPVKGPVDNLNPSPLGCVSVAASAVAGEAACVVLPASVQEPVRDSVQLNWEFEEQQELFEKGCTGLPSSDYGQAN